MQLDQSKIKKWRDLVDSFMKQYKFNLDTPTREQLKAMSKKPTETFKDYAQRWRMVASQVQPPLIQSELCSYFLRTLQNPYYKYMVGTHVTYFSNLIEIGERIDANVREGRITYQDDIRKGQNGKKKEGDVSFVQSIRQPQDQHSKRRWV